MKIKENTPYIPELNFVYPSKPDEHMVEITPVRDVIVDENYPFLDKSFKFRFKRFLIYLGIYVIMFLLLCPLRCGLKIEGRKNLRKHRKLLKNGAMTVSNHVHRWDFVFISLAMRFRTMYFPMRKEHLNGKDAGFMRLAGGIPVPDELRLIKYFNQAFDEIRERKKWIHTYPESCRFDFYRPIRPFKKGVFSMAHRYNLPVLPLAITYRKPVFPYTLVNFYRSKKGRQKLPMITLRIGEPVFLDETLPRKEAVAKLRNDSHEAVVRLAGISGNPYPAEGD